VLSCVTVSQSRQAGRLGFFREPAPRASCCLVKDSSQEKTKCATFGLSGWLLAVHYGSMQRCDCHVALSTKAYEGTTRVEKGRGRGGEGEETCVR
jgi:hypothetical protein